MSDTKVYIRIQNNMGQAIENFWLGPGGTGPAAVPYGPIAAGETTDYIAFGAELPNYSKLNFLMVDGTHYLDTVSAQIDRKPLAPGYYTFAYAPAGDQAQLTISRDK